MVEKIITPTKSSLNQKEHTQILEKYLNYLDNISQTNNITKNTNIKVIQSLKEYQQITSLRSQVFSKVPGFNLEFPEPIPNYQFDKYDENSIILTYKEKNQDIGTIRLIQNKIHGLQSQRYVQNQNKNVVELSRLCVNPNSKNKNVAKQLFIESIEIAKQNNIEKLILLANTSLFNYLNSIGFETIQTYPNYGHIKFQTTYGEYLIK